MSPLIFLKNSRRIPPFSFFSFFKVITFSLTLFWLYAINITYAQAPTRPTTILFLGDSLTEGLGVNPEKAYPSLVEQSLIKQGYAIRIINGGESGSTSAGGLARLAWYLKSKPDMVFIALGGNDGLRGQNIAGMKKNLKTIINKTREASALPLLAGIQIPPNYGKDYTREFAKSFGEIAKEEKVALLPFLLEGVGGQAAMMLPDGIHPNEKGHQKMALMVEKFLKVYLKK